MNSADAVTVPLSPRIQAFSDAFDECCALPRGEAEVREKALMEELHSDLLGADSLNGLADCLSYLHLSSQFEAGGVMDMILRRACTLVLQLDRSPVLVAA